MKAALLAGFLVYVALVVATTFVPYDQARVEAADCGFQPEEIDDGLQFAFERRLWAWAQTGVQFLLLILLALTGFARRFADACYAWTGRRWFLTVLAVAGFCFLAKTILAFPFGLARLEHQRAWDMTAQPLADWLRDRLVSLGVYAVLWFGVLAGLYLLLRLLPRAWWFPATLLGLVGGMGYALVQPLLITPLFNTFTPLSYTTDEVIKPEKRALLEKRLRALIHKADIEVQEILVVDASRQSYHSNAYFAGFGPTRQIVLYDNLVKDHPVEEIETVVAHEIGHWQHHHIVKGIALAGAGCLVALFLLSRILLWARGRPPWYLYGPADPAGIPLVLLLYAVGSWAVMPVQNAVSRHFERQADQTALDLAGQPEAFIRAEERLARKNKSNVAPPPWNVWLFSTHPTTVEAIRMAKEWQAKQRHK